MTLTFRHELDGPIEDNRKYLCIIREAAHAKQTHILPPDTTKLGVSALSGPCELCQFVGCFSNLWRSVVIKVRGAAVSGIARVCWSKLEAKQPVLLWLSRNVVKWYSARIPVKNLNGVNETDEWIISLIHPFTFVWAAFSRAGYPCMHGWEVNRDQLVIYKITEFSYFHPTWKLNFIQ